MQMSNTYGYVRVSSIDQNEDRQMIALRKAGVAAENIFMDKQSGKDFHRASTKKNFKGAKKVSISKSKKTYTKKKLKAKKKYYIRIRAYKTYKDANKKIKKVYGKWTTISKKTK